MNAWGIRGGDVGAPVQGSGARIIVHPRCLDGVARCALEAHLLERGFDIQTIAVGPPNALHHCDLVRMINRTEKVLTLERFDGSRFTHAINPASGVVGPVSA